MLKNIPRETGGYFSFGHSPNNTGCAQVRCILACQPCNCYSLPVNGRSKSLPPGGRGTACGGRSPRDERQCARFKIAIIPLSRTLPQASSPPAPSRREPLTNTPFANRYIFYRHNLYRIPPLWRGFRLTTKRATFHPEFKVEDSPLTLRIPDQHP